MSLATRLAAGLALLAVAASDARAAEPEIRRAFRLEGEKGVVAFRDDLVTLFSAGPTRSVRLAGSKVEATDAHLPRDVAHGTLLCDPFDQLDLGARLDPGVRSALPPAAKVKRLATQGAMELAVYSLPGEGRYYETWLALLERGDGGARKLLKMKRISEGSGVFCGAHPLGRTHLLVLVEGESRGRTVLVAYGLALEP